MKHERLFFNPPPGWPKPPENWRPPAGWVPDPAWPKPPDGWQLWIPQRSPGNNESAGNHEAVDQPSTPPGKKVNEATSDATSKIVAQLEILEAENVTLRRRLVEQDEEADEIVILDDERVLQDVGIYRYHHPLENADTYKARLRDLSEKITVLVKEGKAIKKSNMFTFNNSLAKGRRMTSDLGKLMLRAYNAESDNGIRSLRAGNVLTARKRLEASKKAIAKLGAMMEMRISEEFHKLRLDEIELTADWLMKKKAEREEAKEERARLREEKRVEKELAEEGARLQKERRHIQNAIMALLASNGDQDTDLEAKLAAIDESIQRNDYRLANIRAGYVYVISNRGAFGAAIVKIGLTRRLEPLDRIRELSGASVPFRFDVHALFFSEDAVTLENELHHYFSDRAVNMANSRKEFFFATPGEVREALIEKVGNLLEFTETAEATEYFQSVRYWPQQPKS